MFVFSGLMILLYSATITRIMTGSKYKLLSALVAMLLISNTSTIFLAFSNLQLFVREDYCKTYIWMLGIAVAVQDLTFSISHHILAFQYKKISVEIPKKIKRMQLKAKYKRNQMIHFWVLFAMNTLFPLLEAVVLIPYNETYYIKKQQPDKLS
jgi:Na+/H+ antiporter NhaD/arsenite permease-like protein